MAPCGGNGTAPGQSAFQRGWNGVISVYDWDLYSGRLYVSAHTVAGNFHFYMKDPGTTPPSCPLTNVTTGSYGMALRTYKSKIQAIYADQLRFSCVGEPSQWANATGPPQYVGAGYIILSAEDAEMSRVIGLEAYYDYLAIFSTKACQLWYIDDDPNKNQYKQTLRQSGTTAPKSIRQYGSGDVLFLGSDGIRSLKAREQSVSAAVTDIGSPVDPAIRDLYMTQSAAYMSSAQAMLQPYTGRYWMIFPDRIYVLSNYPNPKISAWCVYVPDFLAASGTITDVAEADGAIYLRTSNHDIYKYGGLGVQPYDTSPVEIVLPFLGLDKPATYKQFKAIDCVCTGEWDVYAAFNPGNTAAEDYLGKVTGPTFLEGQFPMMGHSTHISLRFRNTVGGPATLSSLMIHYDEAETT